MSDLNLKIKITAIAAGLKNTVDKAVGSIRKLGTSSKRTSTEGTGATTRLGRAYSRLRTRIRAARRALRNYSKESDKATQKTGVLGKAFRAIGATLVGASFVAANKDIETLRKGFEVVAGSASAAEKELRFIRNTARELGLPVKEAGDAFLQLSASAKGTALEGEPIRKVYTSVARAMAKLGKSGADTQGALLAISQMMSKGKVSAEELRGQLGERLPGAFKAAAAAMGVTTAELDKMLQNGKVLAEDLLPGMADELNRLYDNGEGIDTFASNWSRLTNNIDASWVAINDATNIMGGLSNLMKGTSYVIGKVTHGVVTLAESFNALGKNVGAFFAFAAGPSSWKEFKENVKDANEEARQAIDKTGDSLGVLDDKTKAAIKSTDKQSTTLDKTGKAAEKAGDRMKRLAAEEEAAASKGRALAAVQKKLTAAIEAAGRAHNKNLSALNKAGTAAQKAKQRFKDLTKELSGKKDTTSILDVFKKLGEASRKIKKGDGDGALKSAEQAAKMLEKIKAAGGATDTTLASMAERLERVGAKAAELSDDDEIIDAKKSLTDLDRLLKKKQDLTEGPIQMKVEVDFSELDNFKPKEIIVPVRYVPVNAPGGDQSTANTLDDASRKRGDT